MNYGDLKRILLDLGFERTVIKGSHVLYERAYKRRPSVIIMLPIMRSERRVAEGHRLGVRMTLDKNGIISGRRFDALAFEALTASRLSHLRSMAVTCYRPIMFIGTTNPGKVAEFATLLAPLGIPIEVVSLDVPEPENTFIGNARLKALAYSAHVASLGKNDLVLCEDSGLVIPSLGDLPGPWSARFADLDMTTGEVRESGRGRAEMDAANNERVLTMLRDREVSMFKRGAFFTAVIVVADKGEILCSFEEQSHGWIAEAPRGEHGFGYDEIFVGNDTYGRTYAELDPVRKNLRSHRKRAMDHFYAWMSKRFCEGGT